MTPMFFVAVSAMLIVALLLVLWPLQRSVAKSMGRLREAAGKLRALKARTADGVDAEGSATLQAAIDEMLLATDALARRGARPGIYAGVALLVCVPLAATALYHRWGSAHQQDLEATHAASHEAFGSAAAPPIDHGVDMQAAIAKLALKLQQHPDDAQGWALLGRTYKAMQQYPQARDAFRHAVEAAPGDTDLAREYAAAETPNPEPTMTDSAGPQACAVPGAEGSECADEPQSATRITVIVALNPKFKDQVAPKDTVFVFAKAAQGPPMPLAIMRLTASQLPASVTLTDGMGMVPNLSLSQFPQIVLGARVSKSGNAMAQPGDLQTLSAAMTTTQTAPVQLTIDHRVD